MFNPRFRLFAVTSAIALCVLITGCGQAPTTRSEPAPSSLDSGASLPQGVPPVGVNVRLDRNTLPADLPDAARVFMFLRPPGERMPLVVQQFSATDIPADVMLAVSQPMDSVELVVRLSREGQVSLKEGDLEVTRMVAAAHPPARVQIGFSGANAEAAQSTGVSSAVSEKRTIVAELRFDGTESPPPDSTVFVVVRDGNRPMPVAVKRLAFRDLPVTVALTDADSMLPTQNLSSAHAPKVSALLSLDGDPSAGPGDWRGTGVRDATTGMFTIAIAERVE